MGTTNTILKRNWYKKSQLDPQSQNTINIDGVNYIKHKHAGNRPMYEIDILKTDTLWQNDKEFYFEHGYENDSVKKFLYLKNFNIPIECPIINVEDEIVNFTDGRHRFVAMRDSGKSKIAAIVTGTPENLKQIDAQPI